MACDGEDAAQPRSGKTLRTHYDNLRVTRDAPIEVIRAAYRALSKKYHPDRHSGEEPARVMRLLNAAYEALSDPVKRRQHDEWIAQSEHVDPAAGYSGSYADPAGAMIANGAGSKLRRCHRWIWLVSAAGAVVMGLSVVAALHYDTRTRQGATPFSSAHWTEEARAPATPAPARGWPYVRRALAPNGMPWPQATGYVEGYAKLRRDGQSSVVLDNSYSRADVFAKLFTLDAAPPVGVRAVFIKAGEAFRVDTVRPGTYEIRFRDLDSGAVARSAPFILAELPGTDLVAVEDMSIVLRRGVDVDPIEPSVSDF